MHVGQHLTFESQTEVFLVLLLLNKHTLKKISWLKKTHALRHHEKYY